MDCRSSSSASSGSFWRAGCSARYSQYSRTCWVASTRAAPEILHVLRLMLKASGKRGVPQGGVISPLLANIYLTEVDAMLERAKEVTRDGEWTRVGVSALRRRPGDPCGRVAAAGGGPAADLRRNEAKSRIVDLGQGEAFGFLGFDFRRVRSLRGRWRPQYTPKLTQRTALLGKLKGIFCRYDSQPVGQVIAEINPILRGWVKYFRIGNAGRCFAYVMNWVEKKVRRHLMRARNRAGFGWTKWSTVGLYAALGLFRDYHVRYGART
jgi:RNA-directed DNA polymerase